MFFVVIYRLYGLIPCFGFYMIAKNLFFEVFC